VVLGLIYDVFVVVEIFEWWLVVEMWWPKIDVGGGGNSKKKLRFPCDLCSCCFGIRAKKILPFSDFAGVLILIQIRVVVIFCVDKKAPELVLERKKGQKGQMANRLK